jgi:hypothetical protein
VAVRVGSVKGVLNDVLRSGRAAKDHSIRKRAASRHRNGYRNILLLHAIANRSA